MATLFIAPPIPVFAADDQFPDDVEVVELIGAQPDSNFGKTVANLGDVNGNGFDDVAIAAAYDNNGSGTVFIYFGGESFSYSEPDLILYGESADDQFGISIAGDMDLNGNGYADIAIGARFSDLGPSNAGAVYVYFGGPKLSDEPSLILLGENADDWFGQSVSSAGDVNASGYDDVLVGAHFASTNGSGSGRGYVFFGGPSMSATPDLTFDGPEADAQLGNDVAGIGDFNDNGYHDIIFGAHFTNVRTGNNAGKAFVIFGGPQMNGNTADLVLSGEAANDQFGTSVSAAGDVAPGNRALLIGAHHNDERGSGAGKTYVARQIAETNPADINEDGVVDVFDLLIVIGEWGECHEPDDCPADITGPDDEPDSVVDIFDLLKVIANWG